MGVECVVLEERRAALPSLRLVPGQTRRFHTNSDNHADTEPPVKARPLWPPQGFLTVGRAALFISHIHQSVSRPEQEQTGGQREHRSSGEREW